MDFTATSAENEQVIANVSNAPLNGGTSIDSGIIDVRQWASYYLRINSGISAGTSIQNSVKANMTFYLDAAGSMVLFADVVEAWIAQGPGGSGVTFGGGPLRVQDIMHGPYMKVVLTNLGPDNQAVDYELLGTTRTLTGPFARQANSGNDTGSDAQLVTVSGIAIPNLSTAKVPALFGYGRTYQRLAAGAGGLVVTITAGEEAYPIDTITLAANGVSKLEYVMPKRSLMYSVSNTSGVASTYSITTVAQLDRA